MPRARDELFANLNLRASATAETIAESEKLLKVKLPLEYVAFLKTANGGEGFIGKRAYIILWGVEELAYLNQAYEVQDYVPGLLLFGSDGGGEAYGFDTRTPPWQTVEVPFVGMAWELARPRGATFSAFLERLHEVG